MHKLSSLAKGSAHQSPWPVAPAPRAPQQSESPFWGNQAALRLSRTPPRIQTKLKVGATNDPLEAEADRLADRVMRMTDPAVAGSNTTQRCAPVISRMCAECDKDEEDKRPNVQRKGEASSAMEGAAPPIVHRALNAPGQPLDPATRSFFEPRFGIDLGSVRLHRDSLSEQSARAIQAKAYTSGHDIVLGNGCASLSSTANRRLLAHELTHVVQQGGDGSSIRRATGPKEIGTPTGTEAGEPVFIGGPTFRFSINSDEWADGAGADLLKWLKTVPQGSTIQIDGYASSDGPKEFNENLSAARALKAKKLMMSAGIEESRFVHLVAHGPTPGPVKDRRSVVIQVLPPAEPQQTQTPTPDVNKQDPKQPETKKPEDSQKDATKPEADTGSGNTPDPRATAPDLNPRVQIQIPISASNFQIPFAGPGGLGAKLPHGQRSPALDSAYQPNMAFGLNYNFMNSDKGVSLGIFGQFGANVALNSGASRPVTLLGDPKSFTGLNAQGYLQPAWVFLAPEGWTMALILQPGVGRTFDSPVPGVNGLTYSFQGGFQVTRDILKNKLQLFGSVTLGFNKTRLDDVPAGESHFQDAQPFFGFAFGIQPLITLKNYPPKKE